MFKERLLAFIGLLEGRRVEMKSRTNTIRSGVFFVVFFFVMKLRKVKQEERNLVDHILRVILFL